MRFNFSPVPVTRCRDDDVFLCLQNINHGKQLGLKAWISPSSVPAITYIFNQDIALIAAFKSLILDHRTQHIHFVGTYGFVGVYSCKMSYIISRYYRKYSLCQVRSQQSMKTKQTNSMCTAHYHRNLTLVLIFSQDKIILWS